MLIVHSPKNSAMADPRMDTYGTTCLNHCNDRPHWLTVTVHAGEVPEREVLGFLKGTEDEGAGARTRSRSVKVNTTTTENVRLQGLGTLELKLGWTDARIIKSGILCAASM